MAYASVTKCGYYPDEPDHDLQDSYTIGESTFVIGEKEEKGLYLAVYAGHGEYGGECSRFCRDYVNNPCSGNQ